MQHLIWHYVEFDDSEPIVNSIISKLFIHCWFQILGPVCLMMTLIMWILDCFLSHLWNSNGNLLLFNQCLTIPNIIVSFWFQILGPVCLMMTLIMWILGCVFSRLWNLEWKRQQQAAELRDRVQIHALAMDILNNPVISPALLQDPRLRRQLLLKLRAQRAFDMRSMWYEFYFFFFFFFFLIFFSPFFDEAVQWWFMLTCAASRIVCEWQSKRCSREQLKIICIYHLVN